MREKKKSTTNKQNEEIKTKIANSLIMLITEKRIVVERTHLLSIIQKYIDYCQTLFCSEKKVLAVDNWKKKKRKTTSTEIID